MSKGLSSKVVAGIAVAAVTLLCRDAVVFARSAPAEVVAIQAPTGRVAPAPTTAGEKRATVVKAPVAGLMLYIETVPGNWLSPPGVQPFGPRMAHPRGFAS